MLAQISKCVLVGPYTSNRTEPYVPYQRDYDKEVSFGNKSIALLRYHELGHLHQQCGKLQT
jgi:hypothetical protein